MKRSFGGLSGKSSGNVNRGLKKPPSLQREVKGHWSANAHALRTKGCLVAWRADGQPDSTEDAREDVPDDHDLPLV